MRLRRCLIAPLLLLLAIAPLGAASLAASVAAADHGVASRPVAAARVAQANGAARVEPDPQGFANAIQRYAFAAGALYQVYASPGHVTDIALQDGERLVGTGPVAAGDTVRWLIGDTNSGTGSAQRVHILVKPIRNDIATNLVINTDRRTYYLELRATPSTWLAAVSWTYPEDELVALRVRAEAAQRAAPVAAGIDPSALDFRYSIGGDRPRWRPARVFDDGQRVYIGFPDDIAASTLPPLFVTGTGGQLELVNYRVAGRFLVVDRLFDRAELRLGDRKSAQRVTIMALARKARP
ncbi:type IV secretion system protein VirB9 [Novosphingobium sp. SG916]|nr:type IV secretion system protein VirB9 [Novosphingobium sp. SG919]NMN85178.1 type IV secretion system protein VirB9 [Novosphingobium sp. SG916]